jgi:hypothetical protein
LDFFVFFNALGFFVRFSFFFDLLAFDGFLEGFFDGAMDGAVDGAPSQTPLTTSRT